MDQTGKQPVGLAKQAARTGKWLLAGECLLLFFLLPVSLYWIRFAVAFRIVLLILLVGLFSGLYLRQAYGSAWTELWRLRGLGRMTAEILAFFVPAAAILTVAAWRLLPDHFFSFPRLNPSLWATVMLLYPLLAAGPQELFFRAFFFHRYQSLFPDPRLLIAVNAASFGLSHLFYGNWVAPALSTLGGLLFGYRYYRTHSVLAVTLEHGLWGDFLFTIGYGWFFYSGQIH